MKRGLELPQLSILDVPSLLLHSLGLAIPASFEGRMPVEAFEPEALESRSVQRRGAIERSAGPARSDVDMGLDEEAEAEIARRLRALGYLE
jgi:hypothetical protein